MTSPIHLLISTLYSIVAIFLGLFGPLRKKIDPKDELLQKAMEQASTYDAWRQAAQELDARRGYETWKELKSETFDTSLAALRLEKLKELRDKGDVPLLMHHLRADLHRGICGLWSPTMHIYQTGSKKLLEDYLSVVVEVLEHILATQQISSQEKYTFFSQMSAAYGHSALVLSGAAALGIYHIGCVKALWEQELLPRVITGTNTGAIVAAIAGARTDEDMGTLFDFEAESGSVKFDVFTDRSRESSEGAWKRRWRRFLNHGVLMDVSVLRDFLKCNIGDITFLEAYNTTGRVLNISVSRYLGPSQGSSYWTLNYLTAPHVVVWSAACASCAMPGIYEEVQLLAKGHDGEIIPYHPASLKWSTGHVASSERAAVERLSELFNINFFIVSQTNLNVIPSISGCNEQREGKLQKLWTLFKEEIAFRVLQLAGLPFWPWQYGTLPLLLAKPFEGDVEIFPAASLSDCIKLFTTPEKGMATRCTQLGEKRTWPKISTISSLCRIERTLDRCTRLSKLKLVEEMPNKLAFFTQELGLDNVCSA